MVPREEMGGGRGKGDNGGKISGLVSTIYILPVLIVIKHHILETYSQNK